MIPGTTQSISICKYRVYKFEKLVHFFKEGKYLKERSCIKNDTWYCLVYFYLEVI